MSFNSKRILHTIWRLNNLQTNQSDLADLKCACVSQRSQHCECISFVKLYLQFFKFRQIWTNKFQAFPCLWT